MGFFDRLSLVTGPRITRNTHGEMPLISGELVAWAEVRTGGRGRPRKALVAIADQDDDDDTDHHGEAA